MSAASNQRNARRPVQPVTPLGDVWGCPACHEMNPVARTDCESCGQRVSIVAELMAEDDESDAAVERGVMSVDQWLDSSPKPASSAEPSLDPSVAETAPDFNALCSAMLDWTCPNCGATVHLHGRPRLRMSVSALILLALALPIGGIGFLIAMAAGMNTPAEHVAMRGNLLVSFAGLVPMLIFAGLGLSRPRVRSIACAKCGFVTKEYCSSPVSVASLRDFVTKSARYITTGKKFD